MAKELEFSLEYWRDRANFFEDVLNELKGQRVELRNSFIERLENENAELKGIMVKLTEAITAQLKYRTDEVIPKDSDAASYVKAYQSRRIRIDTLSLSVRSANALNNENLTTLGQLCRYTEADLLRIPNFGKHSLNEIKEVLYAHGLSLKPMGRD